jgi:hypothetical protein
MWSASHTLAQAPAKGPFAKAEIALTIITGSAITFDPLRLSVPVASFLDCGRAAGKATMRVRRIRQSHRILNVSGLRRPPILPPGLTFACRSGDPPWRLGLRKV